MSGRSADRPICPRLVAIMVAIGSLASGPVQGGETDAGTSLFREKIEPLLQKRCFDCHSHDAGEASGGLMLDSRSGWAEGGDSGPAIIPGKPDASLLIRAVRYADVDVQMPPDGKLPDAEIELFTKWVKAGAADSRVGAGTRDRKEIDLEAGRRFWSYQPVADAPVPEVKDPSWPANAIDRFVLSRLEAQGFRPAVDADRATLARRLYFDLTGLPPTPEEIDAFVHNADPKAYEVLVDRLLASPRFGERWGRHWLDIARFAESVTLRGFVFPEAWRYRDYVIDSFDRDVPFDRFVKEQIAGDLLPAATSEERTRQVVATNYLVLGNTNLEEQDKEQLRMDVVDEQLDVIGKGLLAQTITCARCHDHKFDPIPTKDYYALAGILRNTRSMEHANVSRWLEMPLPAEPAVEAAVAKHESVVAALQDQIKAAKKQAAADGRVATGVLAVQNTPGIVVDDAQAMKVGNWKDSTSTGTYVGAGYTHDLNTDKGEKTITFEAELPKSGAYEVWLSYSASPGRASSVPTTIFSAEGETSIAVDMSAPPPIGGRFVSLGRYRFEKGGQSFVLISNAETQGHVTPDAVTFIPGKQVAAAIERFAVASSEDGKVSKIDDLAALEAEMKKLRAAEPYRPMAMTVFEEETIEDARIHVRGNVHNLSEIAPRGFLRVAGPEPAQPLPATQSGRVELADWIASPENPLTARVYVNRAWHWLFGDGIVRTVDNFGTTGETPSHPELLDHLATRFVEEGWSVKSLVRSIVMSRAYRQSTAGDPQAIAADPENRLFGRMNRRRLDAECVRDAILAASGTLSNDRGGRTFPDDLAADYGFVTASNRRGVYLPVFRNALPELFDSFDFADTSTVTGRRNDSTVPQQALFMMNNPFVVEQTRRAADRFAVASPSQDDRIIRAYRSILGREPTENERRAVAGFLTDRSGPSEETWPLVIQALFASAEFRYLE